MPRIALEELLQNALIHRDYFINAPIRLFIFDNRIEIVSPGSLPNSLSVDNIKFGSSVVRNSLLTSFCSKIMNYRGIGSGIRRAIKEHPNTEFTNDKERELFITTLYREES
ncbi:MAG: ATP-binding protein [Bacteroidales bacterium]